MGRRLSIAARPRPAFDPGRRLGQALSLALLVLSAGCSALSHYRPTQSGLLHDYAALSKDRCHLNRGLGLQRNFSRNATPEALRAIDSYYIEPIGWAVEPDSRAGRDPSRRQVLSAALDQALRDQLGPLRPIVSQPGPNTATVRAFITDARLSRPYTNAALTAAGAFIPCLGPVFFGGATVEAEILDPHQTQITAISCASGGGPLDIVGFYTRTSHARKAMKRAARELRETLTPPSPPPR